MKFWALPLLRCPRTGSALRLESDHTVDEIETGVLVNESRSARYEIRNGIARFVGDDNYAASFGLQWNRFRRSQLDSHSGQPISRERFFRYSGWTPAELAGKLVLDVGCGAGRFAEIALDAGARVVAIDYSSAVDACAANHADRRDLTVLQADIYHLPLVRGAFDYVYCFGVLQHTPDVATAFRELPPMLAPNGRLAIDVYPRLWLNFFWPKYWLRPITRRLPAETLFRAVKRWTPRLLPVSERLSRVPVLGRKLRYLVPVANHAPDYPLTARELEEWAVLDTFDMLSPAHDHPQSLATLRRWFEDAGLDDVWVGRLGFNVGRGRLRATADRRLDTVEPRVPAQSEHELRPQ
jgi:2-polyprenyl-3-methyl-5-hydroxy-6-metoxy-1,4-benzoquinol methylase